MPHVEIKYSDNLDIDTKEVFDVIEGIINKKDSSAGVCKSRAYPCSEYKYSTFSSQYHCSLNPIEMKNSH